MRNMTLTLPDDLSRWVRIEAAHREKSVSAYLRDILAEKREKESLYKEAEEAFFVAEPVPLKAEGEAYPRRNDIYER